MRSVETRTIQFYSKYIFVAHLYLTNKFDPVTGRDFARRFHLNSNFALTLENSMHGPSRPEGSESAYQYLDTSSVTAREAGRAIKRPEWRLSRLLRASPNILIPNARNTRRGSFFKMLLVLRASASGICIILTGICERYAPVLYGRYADGTAIAGKRPIGYRRRRGAIHLRTGRGNDEKFNRGDEIMTTRRRKRRKPRAGIQRCGRSFSLGRHDPSHVELLRIARVMSMCINGVI